MLRTLATVLLPILLLSLTAGCKSNEDPEPPVKTIRDQSSDVTFQSFRGILMRALQNRDKNKLAELMLPDFGYHYPDGEGIAGAFAYWDKENLWPELLATAQTGFSPAGAYMVAPPEFANAGPEYSGYRLGVRRINGSWRFAYFIGN